MDEDWREVMGELDDTISSGTEAIIVVAGLGGGTGSGGAPVLVDRLQQVYDVPVYALGVLPGRNEGAIYQRNAGRSLKTVVRDADSVLLVDNDAWHSAGESVTDAYDAINETIARRVGLLLGSGEITEGVGESVVDSSEIINTLAGNGLAAVGYASAEASEDASENVNVVTSTARRALLTGMSVPDTTTAEAALVVVAGDPDRVSRKGVERARRWVEGETGSMEVRGGDFPLDTDEIAVLVLLAGIERSNRLDEFMERARVAAGSPDRDDPADAFATDDLDGLF
jgi:cell division GTPase FtsZ